MKVALFLPCYVDQFFPDVGFAVLRTLETHGVTVDYPTEQTCCGQPLVNSGAPEDARRLAERFYSIFGGYDYVVCPSGSCTAMVRHHFDPFFQSVPEFHSFCHRVLELCEFLHDVLNVRSIEAACPHKVGLHQSCHGLRELRLSRSSERMEPDFSKVRTLVGSLKGIELIGLSRADECCGFGGTFAVTEAAVSVQMGRDRLSDHLEAGAEIITGVDMSCLMHLDGLIRRQGLPLRVKHVAELFAGQA
ncbi:MAG: (Fe-S)-binding protein [Bdellovibrionota bacterium]